MAVGKEIRTKIASVKNTQKITRAMEMVAAAKLKKTQTRMLKARPYAENIRDVVGHLMHVNPEYAHTYLVKRPIKRVGLIVFTTDRGLCGGHNVNVFRSVVQQIRAFEKDGIEVDVAVVGSKGVSYFKRLKVNVISVANELADTPKLADLIGTIVAMTSLYKEGKIDKLLITHNVFVNTMVQKPQTFNLLPIEKTGDAKLQEHWDYIYEPSAEELLEAVLERYLESQVYRAAVENVACEMASKMVAMKSATDNAGKMIDKLKLQYNKARQAAITQEISEIVSGAAAV
jgi:F-type H+-transporting ATPase subunit gamma